MNTPRVGLGGGPRGFTLIEMLVVVALIAATAAAALLITGNRDQQRRRDTTERLMDDIVHAVVGAVGPVWSGESRLSGFVVDNGRLPASVHELTARDALVDSAECSGGGTTAATLFNCHKARAAVFDPSPSGTDGAANNSGDEETLTAANEGLPKGLRRYLDTGGSGPMLRDGWGNVAVGGDDASNFGWVLSLPATASAPWTATSLGSNNAIDATPPDPDDELVSDLTLSVRPDDWGLDVQGWTVRLTNATGGDLTAGSWVGASLLVWETRAGGGTWRRLTTALHDSGIPAGDSVDLAFPAGGYSGGSLSTRVPIGEHLLVAVRNNVSAVAHAGNDTPLLNVDGQRISAQVRLFPGAGRPAVELILK